MSRQALDLRSSVQAVRRHRKLFGAIMALGLFLGAGYAVLNPPVLSSTALVVLPASASDSNPADPGVANGEMATQVVVASSDRVLLNALPHVSPPMSLQTLENKVQVTNVAGSVLSITATGATAAEAETTANAVANSYISYIGSAQSLVGFISAKMLNPASTATGTKRPEQIAIYSLLGLLGGALIGLIAATAMSNNERGLRERDAIARSIAAPVLASMPVSRPSDPASWVKLLAEYEPGAVHALGLVRILQMVGVAADRDASVAIVSLSSDPRALALGPQLAAFAAAQGVPTTLVVGPQQDPYLTATLRMACASGTQLPGGQRKSLQLLAPAEGQLDGLPDGFTVVVATVDGKAPQMARIASTTTTVLGVSSGGATAEQLARAATAAATSGRDIAGILVADPDPDDQTTGRVPRLVTPMQRTLPTRANDVPTEIKW
jgi:capsular polysaccharide biosynthesis protein